MSLELFELLFLGPSPRLQSVSTATLATMCQYSRTFRGSPLWFQGRRFWSTSTKPTG